MKKSCVKNQKLYNFGLFDYFGVKLRLFLKKKLHLIFKQATQFCVCFHSAKNEIGENQQIPEKVSDSRLFYMEIYKIYLQKAWCIAS